MKNPALEQVAETHYFVRPQIVSALSQKSLLPAGIAMFPGCTTYLDVWKAQLSDRMFDMGTLIRAASAVDTGLRDYYALKKGYVNLTQLRTDPLCTKNIFQRIMPWNTGNDNAIGILKTISVDLNSFRDFPRVQELMLHRHLYAHNLGVIDDDYIDRFKTLTGTDLRTNPLVVPPYPAQDVVWIEPLNRIGTFIEAARRLFAALP